MFSNKSTKDLGYSNKPEKSHLTTFSALGLLYVPDGDTIKNKTKQNFVKLLNDGGP